MQIPREQPPIRLDAVAAARFIREFFGLPVSAKTLANWRSQERGPKVEYFGTKPLYRQVELERWARAAVTPEPPAVRPGRKRAPRATATASP